MARPWENLVKALLAYSVNKVHGLSQLVIHPGPTLRKWDELLTSRKLSGFCSIDAHGMPDYEAEMRTVGFYALLGVAVLGLLAAVLPTCEFDVDLLAARAGEGRGLAIMG